MNGSKTLQSLIYKNFLASSLIPIFVIEVALLILYFGINSYISDKNQVFLEKEVKKDIVEISKREATNINRQLEEVSRYSTIMQNDHQLFFKTNNCFLPNGEAEFKVHKNGAYYKVIDNGGGSIYYSNTTTMDKTATQKAKCSEAMDPFLKSVVETNPLVTQAYFNSWDDMNRIYPFIPDSPSVYGPEIEMELHNFYYDADAKNNPERKPVWTGAYLDPAGQGWMVSNIVPIYRGDFLEGVSGLDVTIDSFVKNVLQLNLPWGGNAFMVDKSGTILAMPVKIESILGLKELKEHIYESSIKSTTEKPEEYNIFRNTNNAVTAQMKKLFASKDELATFTIDETTYFVSQVIVKETGWRMFTVVDRNIALAELQYLKDLSNKIGYFAIFLMIVFYVLFFIYLLKKSRFLGQQIAKPIELLSDLTSNIGKSISNEKIEQAGIKEIDNLVDNFNSMNEELTKRSDELIESSIRHEMATKEAQIFHKLAVTDPLTKVNNRLKLDDVITSEFERAKRYDLEFGIIILDIDHFKEVNDKFGHQSGDKVLVKIATLLKEHIRKVDTVGRWGGEEFLIICPETNREQIINVAENLRKAIEDYQFDIVDKQTASFGVTCFKKEDKNVDTLIKRADDALYESKNNGRNSSTVIA